MRAHADDSRFELLLREAERRVEAAERLPEDAEFSDADLSAAAAIADLRAAATPPLFSEKLEPVDSSVLQVFELLQATWRIDDVPGEMARAHDISRESWPEMAGFIRGFVAVRLLTNAARMAAARAAASADQVINEWTDTWERTIAGQLQQHPDLGTPARAYLVARTLSDRLGVVRERHLVYRRAEVERIEAARRDTEAALESADRQEREKAIGWFEARAGLRFMVRDRLCTGRAIASALRGEAANDDFGNPLGRLTADEGALLRRRAEAAEAIR